MFCHVLYFPVGCFGNTLVIVAENRSTFVIGRNEVPAGVSAFSPERAYAHDEVVVLGLCLYGSRNIVCVVVDVVYLDVVDICVASLCGKAYAVKAVCTECCICTVFTVDIDLCAVGFGVCDNVQALPLAVEEFLVVAAAGDISVSKLYFNAVRTAELNSCIGRSAGNENVAFKYNFSRELVKGNGRGVAVGKLERAFFGINLVCGIPACRNAGRSERFVYGVVGIEMRFGRSERNGVFVGCGIVNSCNVAEVSESKVKLVCAVYLGICRLCVKVHGKAYAVFADCRLNAGIDVV